MQVRGAYYITYDVNDLTTNQKGGNLWSSHIPVVYVLVVYNFPTCI